MSAVKHDGRVRVIQTTEGRAYTANLRQCFMSILSIALEVLFDKKFFLKLLFEYVLR